MPAVALFRLGTAAKYGAFHSNLGLRRGGRVVDRTALEMRHTGNRIGGSNPSLSATSELSDPNPCEVNRPSQDPA